MTRETLMALRWCFAGEHFSSPAGVCCFIAHVGLAVVPFCGAADVSYFKPLHLLESLLNGNPEIRRRHENEKKNNW